MDAHTLDLLEFAKVRDILAGYTACSLGKERAAAIQPLADLDAVRQALAAVSEMSDLYDAGRPPPFGGLHDVRSLVQRAKIGAMLAAQHLVEVADTLVAVVRLGEWLTGLGEDFPQLTRLRFETGLFPQVSSLIQGCIDPQARVMDTASQKLHEIRRAIAGVEERIQGTLKAMLRTPEIRRVLRYPNFTVSGNHYVLPVAREHRHEVQGVVHRASGTGETVYVEPHAVSELAAELALHRAAELREVRRILRWLSGEVGRVSGPLLTCLDVAAELDLIAAKARYSRDFQMSEPELNDAGQLWLQRARHPLLEHLGRAVVPIDVRLGWQFNLLVITGPNTGGKTVALKTTGLLCLMTLSGLHIPAARGTVVPMLDQVLADIGDEQSLEQSLSTFSSHMSRIAAILRMATARSLVLLDELGAGTDPAEGAALGRALLDELDRIGCRALVTTHLGDLKTYAYHNPRAENGAVEFDEASLRPTYRLMIGEIGQSNALTIARRLRVPRRLIQRAARYLRRKGGPGAAELAMLQALRREAEQARLEALQTQQAADQARRQYDERLRELEKASRTAAELDAARAQLKPGDPVHIERFDKPGKVVRIDTKKETATVRVGALQWEIALREVMPEKFR